MSTTLILPAPAKLNLFLHVTGRRADGYHLIETLFQLLDVGDEVVLASAEQGIRRGAPLAGVDESADLTLRAARLLAQRFGVRAGVRITVRKRLPLGGGLGGGSSDAASVLVGLNHLWGLGLDEDELAGLGLTLGADVPVFVRGRSALAAGVGEVLRPVVLAPSWYLVVTPPVQVSTAAIFAAPSLTRDTTPLTIDGFPWGLDTQDGLERFWARTRNDCEPVARSGHGEVAGALDWLRRVAPARMTGTGASVFARFRDRNAAQAALSGVPRGMPALVARGLDRSPLLDAIDAATASGGARTA